MDELNKEKVQSFPNSTAAEDAEQLNQSAASAETNLSDEDLDAVVGGMRLVKRERANEV